MTDVVFSFDVGSPYAWLAAERIDSLFVPEGLTVHWEPVLLGAIFRATNRSSWAQTGARADGIAEVERRARERTLADPVWPDPWPNDGLAAMRAATWAVAQGPEPGRLFALACFALQFVEGVPASSEGFVAHAAARAELDADAAVAATRDPQVKDLLRTTTEEALKAGVLGVPTFRHAGEAVFGDDELDEAAARWTQAMGSLSQGPQS